MKKILFVFTILLVITACSDILEENPKIIATETFYNTAEEIEGAVYAAYYGVGIATAKTTSGMVLINAGEVDYGEGRVTFAAYSDFKGVLATDTRIPNVWNFFYQGIRNANLVIKNAPGSKKATPGQISQYVAEAKFLRAFSYFSLVRNWGGIPLRTEENMVETDVPRSTESEAYDLIVSDLLYAEANLPEVQALAGRATKYAAKTMLADVYLHLGKWADSRAKSLEVINSGKYSLIKVSKPDDFYKIFGIDVITSSEEIFYIKANSTTGTYFATYRHHPSVPYFKGGSGAYALYTDSVSNRFIREWDFRDMRKKFMLYNCNIGFGPTTMLFKKYIDQTTTAGARNDWPAYRYTDVLLMYAEADCQVNNGPSADAVEKLNMVHRRAYGKDPMVASDLDFKPTDYNKNSFIDLVLKEGAYEQMDEGKRFFVLKRTGKLKDAVKYARGIDVVDTHLLWPIPAIEYLYNKAIDPVENQNPGY